MKLSRFFNNKGFTLVELLIVIVIIGILSIAIFAAIDPIDQTRRGQDTAARSFATQISQAVTRYYATYGQYPWEDSSLTSPTIPNASTGTDLDAFSESIGVLVNSGELNQNFTQIAAPYEDKIFVGFNSTTDQVAVCFKPASKAFKKDANNVYSQAGSEGTCDTSTRNDCYICLK